MRDRVTTINDGKLDLIYNQTVKTVTEDMQALRFNVAISQMMVFVNEAFKADSLPLVYMEGLVKMLSPIAPHITEELWALMGHDKTITYAKWPTYDESKLVVDEVELAVQVNGKVRAHITVAADAEQDAIKEAALADEVVKTYTEGHELKKVIVVPKKIVNIVVGK